MRQRHATSALWITCFWATTVVATLGTAQDQQARDSSIPEQSGDLAQPVPVLADGEPIVVDGFAAPFVGDIDGDGKHDLLVGQYHLGTLRVYRNLGTNTHPDFQSFEWFTAGGRTAGIPTCCQVAFTPQLADFDGDGRTDLLTGSGVSGEVFLFRRQADRSFAAAEVLTNQNGEVRMHRVSRRGTSSERRYNVTAIAYDWDQDGDADLLLGTTPLALVLNKGTTAQPRFDEGRAILCDGRPILGGLSSHQMADWDGDGLDDLIAGEKRDIVWYRNVGQPSQPQFETPRLLVPNIASSPLRKLPTEQRGYHHAFCAADFNSDGRLDLLVGDRYRITVDEGEAPHEPSSTQTDELAALRAKYNELAEEPKGEMQAERIERYRARLHMWQQRQALMPRGYTSSTGKHYRRGSVWYFQRLAPPTAAQ